MATDSTREERETFKARLRMVLGANVVHVQWDEARNRWVSDLHGNEPHFAWLIWLPTYRVACEFQSERDGAKRDALRMATERDEANARLNTPETRDFARGVVLEAEHQRQRWGSDHDAGKTAPDWMWLLGYLVGKAVQADKDGDLDKMRHHIITSAAALANWHAQLDGQSNMRPGIIPSPALVDG